MPAIDRLLAPAKLTRSLAVVGRRDDGFHLLEAEMVSLDLADELEIGEGDGLEVVDAIAWSGAVTAADGTDGGRGGASAAFGVPAGPDNLVARALRLVGRTARVRLVKRVPPGAGLGGGSSDAAAVLRWAGWTDLEGAARLGADVPFCVTGGRARVTGIGDHLDALEPIDETYVVVSPPFGVSSAAAYRAFDELGPGGSGEEATNDLERAACAVEPRLVRWRAILAEAARRPPRLAGSGSSWFFPCGPGGGEAKALLDEVRHALAAAGERAALNLCKAVGPGAP